MAALKRLTSFDRAMCKFLVILNLDSYFPAFTFQTQLLIQAQLTRETEALSPELQRNFKRVLELAPRLLEELMKVMSSFWVQCMEPNFW